VEALASGIVDRVLWFSLWGGEYGSFALVRPDLTPTLPLAAYTSLADRLAGAEFVREAGDGDNVRSFSFRSPRGTFDIVWSPRGKATIDLQKLDKVFDLYGFPVAPPPSARLTVDRLPWFIERSSVR
jgi:hypothetical protein